MNFQPTNKNKRNRNLSEQATALYCRLSCDDDSEGDSNSIKNQVVICKGWFLPSNTYDCSSFVVN